MTRRSMLGAAATLPMAAIAHGAEQPKAAAPKDPLEPFGYCFNTSTIRGQKLPFAQKLEIIARAGFTAIEPWWEEITTYLSEGGTTSELRKRVADLGLSIESVIAFHDWIVDDDARRTKALEQAKRDLTVLAEVGAKRVAAPPAGAIEVGNLDLRRAAERYRALLEVGQATGVVPQVELWGFSKSLSKLSEVSFVAIESGHPDACILLDVYHLYKGGGTPESLRLIGGTGMHVMHVNDYPADPPRAEIGDASRVFPGDGVAPLGKIFRTLKANGYRGYLSLELFNRDWWNEDAMLVARTGYEKLRSAVRAAFAEDA